MWFFSCIGHSWNAHLYFGGGGEKFPKIRMQNVPLQNQMILKIQELKSWSECAIWSPSAMATTQQILNLEAGNGRKRSKNGVKRSKNGVNKFRTSQNWRITMAASFHRYLPLTPPTFHSRNFKYNPDSPVLSPKCSQPNYQWRHQMVFGLVSANTKVSPNVLKS